MVISKNVTFRRKRRPLWYGMLCLVLITAAVAAVGLFPSHIDDAMPTDGEEKYFLTDGDEKILESSVLEEIIEAINNSDNGSVFTIIVNGNDTISEGFTLKEGIEVTLTSSSEGPFTLTVETFDERHFTVFGILTLENIIIDGNKTGGGIEVKPSGKLVMNDGTVIQQCKAELGGGVYVDHGMFTMEGGEISGNTATLGGGVYFSSNSLGVIKGGKISGNTAIGTTPQKGSGGGIYTEKYENLTVKDGVIFTGNTAPSLRVNDIWFDYRDIYRDHIGDVKLDKMLDVIKKEQAPAYNNFDINHPGDAFVVPINIISNNDGTVDVKYENEKLLLAGGYLFVPLACDEITISVTPNEGYEFKQMIINGGPIIDENPFTFDINKNMTVSVELFLVTTLPEQPEQPEQQRISPL